MRNVPRCKLEDGSFWYFLLRQMVYPAASNGPEVVYNHLLPFLTELPIVADLHEEESDFSPEAINGDRTHARLIFGPALRRALALAGIAEPRARYLSVHALSGLASLLSARLLDASHAEGYIKKPTVEILHLVARRIEHEASLLPEEACSTSELNSLAAAADGLRSATNQSVAPPPSPLQPFLDAAGAAAGSMPVDQHPLFGRLRTDGLDLESLAGREGMARVLRPAELSAVADEVKDVKDALKGLRRCVQVCTILSNQSEPGEVRNSYCLRASLISHLFTQVGICPPLPSHCLKSGSFHTCHGSFLSFFSIPSSFVLGSFQGHLPAALTPKLNSTT